jgi:hypothetical protein
MKRRLRAAAFGVAALTVTGCEVETGEDAEEAIEEHREG